MIGNLSHFWRITRELDLNAIREDFERRGAVQILGSDPRLVERVRELLVSDGQATDVLAGVLGEPAPRGPRIQPAGYVVVLGGSLHEAARRQVTELALGDQPLVLIRWSAPTDLLVLGVPEDRTLTMYDGEDYADQQRRLVGALVRAVPQAMLPLARRYPSLRAPVAEQLIRDSSRANAQFAALASIPATLPLVGGVVGDFADIVVLTKNQIVLLFKLAGLYGRNLELGRELLAEIVPVVGGAFAWRSSARMLVGLLPGMVAIVPKVVVAYSGTYLVGQMARYYYEHGRKPAPEIVRQMSVDGQLLAKSLAQRISRRGS